MNAHPNTLFAKAIRCNMVTPLPEHKNKWDGALHVDRYYMVGMMTDTLFMPAPKGTGVSIYLVGMMVSSYLGYVCIIIIVSKEENYYLVSIVDNPQCICLKLAKMSSMIVAKRGQ